MTNHFHIRSWRYHNVLATHLLTERKGRKVLLLSQLSQQMP